MLFRSDRLASRFYFSSLRLSLSARRMIGLTLFGLAAKIFRPTWGATAILTPSRPTWIDWLLRGFVLIELLRRLGYVPSSAAASSQECTHRRLARSICGVVSFPRQRSRLFRNCCGPLGTSPRIAAKRIINSSRLRVFGIDRETSIRIGENDPIRSSRSSL